jgi:sialate O-acetylesterase
LTRFILAAAITIAVLPARADVALARVFGNGMVLQQGMKVPVWGTGTEGEEVTVAFQGQRFTTKVKDGKWIVRLNPLKANASPESLKVDARSRVTVDDVLVGEVWICSGQSNMELKLKDSFESKADIEASTNPNIRLLTITKRKENEPVSEIGLKDISAVAYYFGRSLQKSLDVPVGLIHTSWGGSPAEVWMSHEALASNPAYALEILDDYDKKVAAGKKPGWKPSELYNGMIYPLAPFAAKGAIWYQGESNAGRAAQYRTLFPDMIKNWRQLWGQTEFSFLAVQLAPFDGNKKRPLEQILAELGESNWAELREAQVHATKILPKVGIAVITDIGEKDDIHPKKKAPVGERLALAARGVSYGEKIEYSGPMFKSMSTKTDKALGVERAILTFDHVGSGLEAHDGDLTGFSIAGADKKFVWAKTEILPDNKLAVWSPDIKKPVAVRYGWADFPVVNLWNKDGLPASPFRTDEPKK